MISKNSKNKSDYGKRSKRIIDFLKKNLISNEIIIGMGAGTISQWMRDLKYSL